MKRINTLNKKIATSNLVEKHSLIVQEISLKVGGTNTGYFKKPLENIQTELGLDSIEDVLAHFAKHAHNIQTKLFSQQLFMLYNKTDKGKGLRESETYCYVNDGSNQIKIARPSNSTPGAFVFRNLTETAGGEENRNPFCYKDLMGNAYRKTTGRSLLATQILKKQTTLFSDKGNNLYRIVDNKTTRVKLFEQVNFVLDPKGEITGLVPAK